jgi:hypothetical protein
MLKFKNITWKGRIQHLIEHYFPTFLQKEAVKEFVKNLNILWGSDSREPAKEFAYVYCWNFFFLFFSAAKLKFEK